MRFCPKCGNMMKPEKRGGHKVFVCLNCGYVEKVANASALYSSVAIPRKRKKEIIVVSDTDAPLSKVRGVKCPKCENDEAYWWQLQTRSADEAPTTFYKCTKCGHVWRDYR